ncbi:transcriptional regulator with XRE-family HTH domain [Streptomyces sp. SAI-208]|uniref:tetratricopeptide repeat protein n=1 Tax=Streptomyces sp. SAI-208 TaxID=2940550 RepID=UPI00247339B1|nr:tetratricopeptide repeat protein [Streptomyces sp. SAI-208]MDH6604487.1 transcriptional regulator with XRE-family HTH domain [Streptomyces sp. SAI-208]
MHEEPDRRSPAQAELRRRLDEARAQARLDQTQLAGRAHLGRTTVSKALSPRGGVPSVDTVTALARALQLPAGELLELRRAAVEETGQTLVDVSGPGRPIGQWEPHELEVHPAGPGTNTSGVDGVRALPGYVRREHDQVLGAAVEAAAAGRSTIVVLVGSSSTGKTRACWQAVQPLAAKAWRLWHPFDPTRAEAALEDLHRVGPRTVVWLNEAQHYLGDRQFGERIAAAVHQLLIDDTRGPVLVLGTLWPEYFHDYTALPQPGDNDLYSRVRELLAGHTVSVPDTFDTTALAAATALADWGDALLADALTRNRDGGRITQDLAGAPELLRRYEQPRHAASRVLLQAAMDARRLGVGLHLPQAFLTDAAPDYLSDHDYDQLGDDWAEHAYAELAEQVHGKQAPLRRTNPRPPRRPPTPTANAGTTKPQPSGPAFRLADYLEQHGRTTRRHLCPPASFWHAAHTHLTHHDDLDNLANAAEVRHRLQWAHRLLQRAADHGDTNAMLRLAEMREKAGDRDGAMGPYQQAAVHGDTDALYRLAEMREEAGDRDGAEALARQAAVHGDTSSLRWLAEMREEAGDRDGAMALYQQAAVHGDTDALYRLAWMRKEAKEAGDWDGAMALARQAAVHGDTSSLRWLAEMREEAGDRDGAMALYQQAAVHGDTDALYRLAWMRKEAKEAGDWDGAMALARQAAVHGDTSSLRWLAEMREEAGDRDGAEALARQAAQLGDTSSLRWLAEMREEAGDRDGAEALARQAAQHGDAGALYRLAKRRDEAGDRDGATALYQQAVQHGNTDALYRLAWMRKEAGDWDGAEALARQAAEHGNTNALYRLAEMREEAGDRDGAMTLYQQAAQHGDTGALYRLVEMREEAGDRDGAEALARQAAQHGDTSSLRWLAEMREEAGDRDGAEALARQAAEHGNANALYRLAEKREEAGDRDGAMTLARQAADYGDTSAYLVVRPRLLRNLCPYGLNPDGTPTSPWSPSVAVSRSGHVPPATS